jgi:hypothetical protein
MRSSSSGEVAKRLCSGLQSRLGRFDSDPRLQIRLKNQEKAHFNVGFFRFCRQFSAVHLTVEGRFSGYDFSYDPFGNLAGTVALSGNVIEVGDELLGREISLDDPDRG